MVFQAFVDESFTQGATYVLGGYIADADAWAHFAKDWDEILPLATRSKSGALRFKMKEMAASPNRMKSVPTFYSVIEKYDLFSLSCRFNLADLKRAKQRVYVPNLKIDWGYMDNPYAFAFRALMDMFHSNRALLVPAFPLGQKIDFIFDKRNESKAILAAWDDYIKARPDESREHYGANPGFEDDETFLPLQAADFWAWWVRRWTEEGVPEKIETRDFGQWKATKRPRGADISFTEDQIHEAMAAQISEGIEPGRPIYDVGPFRWKARV